MCVCVACSALNYFILCVCASAPARFMYVCWCAHPSILPFNNVAVFNALACTHPALADCCPRGRGWGL